MGIPVHLTLVGVSPESADKLLKKTESVFNKWDKIFSRFRPDSELNLINQNTGKWNKTGRLLFEVIYKCVELSKETSGAFDPSVGGYLAAAGYGLPKNYSLPNPPPTYKNILFDNSEYSIKTASGQILEPAAIVKGMAIDDSGKELIGVPAWMINAGGDILTKGEFPEQSFWKIAIQSPTNKAAILTTVKIQNEAIATSGDYETRWMNGGNEWHHQIDTKTGKPTRGIKSVSVIAKNAEIADTRTSIISLIGIKEGIKYAEKKSIPYMIVSDENKIFRNTLFEKRIVT